MDYEETTVQAVVREVREETGYDVEVGPPLAEDTLTGAGIDRPDRPFEGRGATVTAGIVDLGAALLRA